MDPRERLARLAQLKAEGDAIMQELIAAGMRPEQIIAAVESGGQATPQIPPGVGMGAGRGPDLPQPVRGANPLAGIEATNAAMGMNRGPRGMNGGPRGLLGAV